MLYFLSFRDIASSSLGVTSGEVYALDVDPKTNWQEVQLAGANWVSWDQVANVFRNKHVVFVIHGFNVNVDHAVKGGGPAAQEYQALGSMALNITAADIVVPVLWPGDGLIGWSWFNAYQSSSDTGAKFAEFLASSAFTASMVSFISHSLGARVVLETVADAQSNAGTNKAVRARFDTAVLTAAAVGDNALDEAQYAPASAALRRIVILSSMKDSVLKTYFTLGSAAEQALWANYDDTTRALGRYGPAFAAGSKVPAKTEWYEIKTGIAQDHGDYLPDGWLAPPGVWPTKQQDVGRFCQETFDAKPYEVTQPNWGLDHTQEFRPDWKPRF